MLDSLQKLIQMEIKLWTLKLAETGYAIATFSVNPWTKRGIFTASGIAIYFSWCIYGDFVLYKIH